MAVLHCHRRIPFSASCTRSLFFFFFFVVVSLLSAWTVELCRAGSLSDEFEVIWAPSNVRFDQSGASMQLVLEQSTGGAGFASKNYYLYGNIDMQIKLVPGDSAGTVTAYYLSSETSNHDELDFEFLGNSSGQPYILQTNVFANGVGGREQRIYLWFDPTTDFHTYSVAWSKQHVLFLVDGTPIRVFSNNEAAGVPYLDSQPMRVMGSIWNGDSWATRGGLVKLNWANSPFIATFRNFQDSSSACVAASAAACTQAIGSNAAATPVQPLDSARLQWVQKNYMVYDFCSDHARYPTTPTECTRQF